MLPRPHRLRTERDFRSILRSRRVYRGRLLTVRVFPNTLAHHRFGFVVSRRVSKAAVERNQIKRRLRAIVRTIKPTTANHDFLISANPLTRRQTQATLTNELQKLIAPVLHGPTRH